MPETTQILKSQAGIKRDGTRYEGDFYVDGQWVRFQRGLPRKIGGYRSINKRLAEISRGFTSFTQQGVQYCHSAGASRVERFTIDATKNSSVITDRTPVATVATGTFTLTGGTSGAVDRISVNSVVITSGPVAFNSDFATTAAALVANINAHVSTPNYQASSVGAVVTITAQTVGAAANGFVVSANVTGTLTFTTTNLRGGTSSVVASAQNRWMFQTAYDASTTDNSLIAHVAPNLEHVSGDMGGQIFYGPLLGTSPLIEIAVPDGANATGGVVMLFPYLFYYGTAGVVGWSIPGDFTDLRGAGSGMSRVWGQKIVKAMPLRAGSGSAPAGVLWAYDAVIRVAFTGGPTVFQFDIIATDTSIMSADSVVDYDGVFFWCGVDRFLMFSGVVREVPNQMNLNYFFDGLNVAHRSKVFAFKETRYGEIWWCYPRGEATECTHAVIYNVRENCWYDTSLPDSGRASGAFNNGFAAPLLTDCVPADSGYRVWIHEQGLDAIDGQLVVPVRSYFETADLSSLPRGRNAFLRITAIEPDFIQRGVMTVQVTGRANARAPEVRGSSVTFPESAIEPYQQVVVLKEQRRELRVRFESNTLGGDYQMGQVVGHFSDGDKGILG